MRFYDRESKASAEVVTIKEYSFWRSDEHHEVTCVCPICGGDGYVYYQQVDDDYNEQRFDCPNCYGDGEITTEIYIDEIEEYETHEDNETVTPYEDNNISFGGNQASDYLGSSDERKASSLINRFLNSAENKEKIEKIQKEKENKERLEYQKEQIKLMISNLFAEAKSVEDTSELVEVLNRMM